MKAYKIGSRVKVRGGFDAWWKSEGRFSVFLLDNTLVTVLGYIRDRANRVYRVQIETADGGQATVPPEYIEVVK